MATELQYSRTKESWGMQRDTPIHRLSHAAHEKHPAEEKVRKKQPSHTHFTAHDDNSRSANGELGKSKGWEVTAKLRAPVFNISLYFVASAIHSY